jgi:hypothetical protein
VPPPPPGRSRLHLRPGLGLRPASR